MKVFLGPVLLSFFAVPPTAAQAVETTKPLGLNRKVTVAEAHSGTLREVLEWFSNAFDVTIYLEVNSFPNRDGKPVEEMNVRIPAQKNVALKKILEDLVKSFDGRLRERPDHVEIVSAKGKMRKP